MFLEISHWLTSPPAHVLAGFAIGGAVAKTSEKIESLLSENTKLEIAVWLLDRKSLTATFQNWPTTFDRIFKTVFGRYYFSWKCLWRSWAASLLVTLSFYCVAALILHSRLWELDITLITKPFETLVFLRSWYHPTLLDRFGSFIGFLICVLFVNVLPDYLLIGETRLCLYLFRKSDAPAVWLLMLISDLIVTLYTLWYLGIRLTEIGLYLIVTHRDMNRPIWTFFLFGFQKYTRVVHFGNTAAGAGFLYPGLLTSSIWLWLYAVSGLLIKASRRFDVAFEWFNSHIDIEKRPLQAIGLVTGALLAIAYWVVALILTRFG